MILIDKLKEYNSEIKSLFIKKIQSICLNLKIDVSWLMILMYIESSLDPKKVNITSGATGLIQFMPSTARSLGTNVADIKNMNSLDQLEYVYKYLFQYRGKIKNIYDLYFSIFFPAAIGKNDDYVLETKKLSAAIIANQNKAYDINKDNKITVGEVKAILSKRIKIIYDSYEKKKQ